MDSPHELRNLAWNCRSLANHTESKRLRSSLMQMASRFEENAGARARERAPNTNNTH